MKDYQRIAAAIRFLDEHRAEQADLATVAAEIGLSPSRFQRMFSAWAGATPKDFLQSLTLSHARSLLRHGADVLNATVDPGLTGSVSLDAATPGEIKARGSGMTICAGVTDSPFGHCLIGETTRGICHLSFFDEGGREAAIAELHADWPQAALIWNDRQAARIAKGIFSPAPNLSAPLKLYVRGTPFQLRVWHALLRVPPGALVSYGTLATAAGNAKASRATGSAVGRNAISWLIPCHRVIRETGIPGHYRWGAVRKHAMLAWESVRTNPDRT
jgi:AraC family transcriptional regulator of adaptative response/methylated-DNA-[protein]-cysteine methyltransferase